MVCQAVASSVPRKKIVITKRTPGKNNIKRFPQKSKPFQVWLKADFVDSTIFAYDYRLRLAYV